MTTQLATNTDLNTVTNQGVYDVPAPVNGPTGASEWAYLEVIPHSNGPSHCLQRYSNLADGGPAGGRLVTWERRRVANTWLGWRPVSGFATPSHFGASGGASTPSGAVSANDAAALQRWLNSGLPLLLDGWYGVNGTILSHALTGENGLTIHGLGARSGLVLSGGSGLAFTGGDQDNPTGVNFDNFTLHDFNLVINQNSSVIPLSIVNADGDSGSAMPGIDMCNVHFVPANTSSGATDACIRLRNVRNGDIQNVSGMGRYFTYQGDFIRDEVGPGSAPVERSHYAVKAAHFRRGFVLNPSEGAIPNDDAQGYHWDACSAIAVDRGWDLNGGQGFSEWFTLSRNHSYFRELGVFTTNCGNVRVENGYFLAHGALGTSQGIAVIGSSIEPVCFIESNRIRLDGSTAANRYGINASASLSGRVAGNRTTGATSAYGLVPSSFTSSDNA